MSKFEVGDRVIIYFAGTKHRAEIIGTEYYFRYRLLFQNGTSASCAGEWLEPEPFMESLANLETESAWKNTPGK